MKLFDANEFLTEVVKLQALSPEHAVAKIILLLSDMNGVDAVPVVRCKDCKWAEYGKSYEPYCNHWQYGICGIVKDDDYCSYGERKGNER